MSPVVAGIETLMMLVCPESEYVPPKGKTAYAS
jgi:hypothetical protein